MAAKPILILIMILGNLSTAGDPFSGSWKLNLSKSQLPPPLPRNQTVQVIANADGIQLSEELVTDTGERMTITVKAKFDGKD